MRRTVLLAALVTVAAVLVVLIRPPARLTGLEAARGHRVFRLAGPAVQSVSVTLEGRSFTARRTDGGWQIDGRAAGGTTAAALDDLLATLVRLRAVDVFRPKDGASFGLDRPRGTIEVVTAHRTRRLLLGGPNSAGSAFYARRPGDPRVLQVGVGLLSEIERVFFHREHGGPPATARAQRPEIG